MNTYPLVYLTYHADGEVGIGTPPQVKDASAPMVMGEPVEHLRVMMSNQEPEAVWEKAWREGFVEGWKAAGGKTRESKR
jgi:hypothetical protein